MIRVRMARRRCPRWLAPGIAHLYFESIHPFEDGNGRIGRAIAEKALAQGAGQPSLTALSLLIHRRRKDYYSQLQAANKDDGRGSLAQLVRRSRAGRTDSYAPGPGLPIGQHSPLGSPAWPTQRAPGKGTLAADARRGRRIRRRSLGQQIHGHHWRACSYGPT